jgi:beta-glucanase (GH16 family)
MRRIGTHLTQTSPMLRAHHGALGFAWVVSVLSACKVGEPPANNQNEPEPTQPSAEWVLAWADEFDGPRLDATSWNIELMPNPFNEELQYYPDRPDNSPNSNILVEDGMLIIEARREDFGQRKYTSGRINTKAKREFLYGRFEARIRLPAEVGMWPAFWMLGGNIDQVGWPACGEIDIMEGKGRLPTLSSGALHRGPDAARNQITSAQYVLPEGNFHDEWHLFSVEWEPAQIRWYVDETLFQVVNKPVGGDPAYWPFDTGQSFFLILNLAVGGWFDSPYVPPDDLEPQRLLVDYVRVYERASSS